jgi:hypothetical protein
MHDTPMSESKHNALLRLIEIKGVIIKIFSVSDVKYIRIRDDVMIGYRKINKSFVIVSRLSPVQHIKIGSN